MEESLFPRDRIENLFSECSFVVAGLLCGHRMHCLLAVLFHTCLLAVNYNLERPEKYNKMLPWPSEQ